MTTYLDGTHIISATATDANGLTSAPATLQVTAVTPAPVVQEGIRQYSADDANDISDISDTRTSTHCSAPWRGSTSSLRLHEPAPSSGQEGRRSSTRGSLVSRSS